MDPMSSPSESLFGLGLLNITLILALCIIVPVVLYKFCTQPSPFGSSGAHRKPKLVADVAFSYGVEELQGKRNYMEDRHVEAGTLAGDASKCFYGVFDGHGGSRAADFCVRRLVALLEGHPEFTTNPHKALVNAFVGTDNEFLEQARRHKWDDGTTACGALFFGDRIMVANAGDSRAIVVQRHGKVVPLSLDHKPNRSDEKERIKKCGGSVFLVGVWRVEGILAVSRAIGDRVLKRYVTAEPDIADWHLTASDRFLVIGSDGLWDVMSNEEVGDLIHKLPHPQEAARVLVECAYGRGSTDNITALVVDLTSRRMSAASSDKGPRAGAGMAQRSTSASKLA